MGYTTPYIRRCALVCSAPSLACSLSRQILMIVEAVISWETVPGDEWVRRALRIAQSVSGWSEWWDRVFSVRRNQ